jgi:DNA-directed RNA polymerase subunit RPC12/RpoP
MHRIEVCASCNAEFHITHHLDLSRYRVTFCPFCGEENLEDESYEIDDLDEDWNELATEHIDD